MRKKGQRVPEDVIQLIGMDRAQGEKIEVIAALRGLSPNTVSCICRRKGFKSLISTPNTAAMPLAVGDRYSQVVVVADLGTQLIGKKGLKTRMCIVQCDCGGPVTRVRASNLRAGITKSCGCLRRVSAQRA